MAKPRVGRNILLSWNRWLCCLIHFRDTRLFCVKCCGTIRHVNRLRNLFLHCH